MEGARVDCQIRPWRRRGSDWNTIGLELARQILDRADGTGRLEGGVDQVFGSKESEEGRGAMDMA